MKFLLKTLFFFFCLYSGPIFAQATSTVSLLVTDEKQKPIENATVELHKAENNALVKVVLSNNKGLALFEGIARGKYFLKAYFLGFSTQQTLAFESNTDQKLSLTLVSSTKNLNEVAVSANKPFAQHTQGKTTLNVDAVATNAGASVLEVLEKSPGVMVDKNGGISLQGKTSVLVLIDDKPTYLSGTELNNLLNGMSAAQVTQIELITSPSAKYDANGNAGIINIKTKKSKQQGFNGNLSTNIGQGKYLKNTNSLGLNYREGKMNVFLNLASNYNKGFYSIYAYRNYLNSQGAVANSLEQDSYLGNENINNTLKTGLDFYASQKTTLGFTL